MSDTDESNGVDRVMVDIETLGRERGAAILSIGAVRFDSAGVYGEFYRSVNRESCEAAGLTVEEDTLSWWQGQDEAAREVLHGGEKLADVLFEFTQWFEDANEIWANSPSFDCEILEAAYEAVGLVEPWEFYHERDARTIKNLPIAPELEQDGTEHDALDDAAHQARIVSKTLERMEAMER